MKKEKSRVRTHGWCEAKGEGEEERKRESGGISVEHEHEVKEDYIPGWMRKWSLD